MLRNRPIPQIPLPTTCIACADPALETQITQALNTCSREHGLLVWPMRDARDSNQWILTLENRIQTHINSGRFSRASRLIMVGCPKELRQARAIDRVCPNAYALYIGPDHKMPHPDARVRGMTNAFKDLIALHHAHRSFEPSTLIEVIVREALVDPAQKKPTDRFDLPVPGARRPWPARQGALHHALAAA